jgi:hypothetical protein
LGIRQRKNFDFSTYSVSTIYNYRSTQE